MRKETATTRPGGRRVARARRGVMRTIGDDRGVVSIIAAVSMFFVMAATALSVDVGHVVFRDRRLESVVDLAAIDAARAIGNRRDPSRSALEVAEEFARESATRNEFDYDDTDAGNSLTVELGIYEPAADVFVPFPAASPPELFSTANAVRVTGTTNVNYAFMPGASDLSADTVVQAVPKTSNGITPTPSPAPTPAPTSTPTPTPTPTVPPPPGEYLTATAAFTIGTTLASITTSDSFLDPILGELLGTSVDLQAGDYDGLASAAVTLGAIWSELDLDAGSPSSVLDTEVSLLNLIDAAIEILDDGDVANASAVAALLVLRSSVESSVDGSLEFTFGSLVDLGVNTPGSAADATVSVLGLVTAAAEVANGTNAVTIDLPVNVPGVASGTIAFAFVEPPAFASGAARQDADGNWVTRAHSAQARILITLDLADGITVGTTTVPVRVPVYIEAGSADGALTGIDCSIVNTDSVVTVDAATDPLAVYIGEVNPDAMSNADEPVTVSPATLAQAAGVVTVTGYGQKTVEGQSAMLTFDGPYDQRIQQVGGASINLDSFDTLDVSASGLGILTASVESTMRTKIGSVLEELEGTVLEPLSKLPLGIAIGGATVTNPSADCIYQTIVN